MTNEREKELQKLAREIDGKMAPLRLIAMSDELVVLNTQRGRILDELYGMTK
jgi:hypothetical protein